MLWPQPRLRSHSKWRLNATQGTTVEPRRQTAGFRTERERRCATDASADPRRERRRGSVRRALRRSAPALAPAADGGGRRGRGPFVIGIAHVGCGLDLVAATGARRIGSGGGIAGGGGV